MNDMVLGLQQGALSLRASVNHEFLTILPSPSELHWGLLFWGPLSLGPLSWGQWRGPCSVTLGATESLRCSFSKVGHLENAGWDFECNRRIEAVGIIFHGRRRISTETGVESLQLSELIVVFVIHLCMNQVAQG